MATKTKKSKEVKIDRRRSGGRRKEDQEPVEALENDSTEQNAEQPERRKVQRRRQIDPTTCERDYTNDEIEFMQALDDYKRASGRMFPTCSEILEVVRDLGYVRLYDAAGQPVHPLVEGQPRIPDTKVAEEADESEDATAELSSAE